MISASRALGSGEVFLGLKGAWCKPHDGVTDPLIAEALSLRGDVVFAKLRGFRDVVMEVNCLEVVNLWNFHHNSRSAVALLLLKSGNYLHVLALLLFSMYRIIQPPGSPLHQARLFFVSYRELDGYRTSFPSQ